MKEKPSPTFAKHLAAIESGTITRTNLTGRRTIVNGVEITPETIIATREHFAQISRDCIADAQSGRTRVNDLASYVAWREQAIADTLAGKGDHTLTFMQRALWLQTGDCPALLS